MTRYALVIGISQYQRREKLPKATQDAEAIAQLLTDSGDYEVTRLPWRFNEAQGCKEMIAETVEGKQLEEELRTFLLQRAQGGEALIYFTGHGCVQFNKAKELEGYLVASDEDNFDLYSLNKLILQSSLRNLVVLLDCCHSGTFIEANIFKNTLTAFTAQKDYYFITASRGFEESFAVDSDKHSIFTQALLDGMSREKADEKGRISGDRLFDYISQAPTVSGQEPIRLGWGKSLILIKYPVEKQTAVAFNNQNPYRGLQPFEFEQADYFKGRETAVRVLIDRLENNRFLAVIGASGCGKSSLVKAGLLPELNKSNHQLQIQSMKPGDRPLIGLQEILMQGCKQTQPYILFIDQFEEVFTLCKDETERRDFIHAVTAEATIPDRKTRVIITIRSDFIERCADYQEAATLINRDLATTYFVKKLELKELLEAIEEPARKNGVSFEPELALQIVNDVEDQPGALPLLQFALKALWQVCIEESTSEQRLLTESYYKKIGGVRGALNQQANVVYDKLMSDAEKEFVKDLFMELVKVEENQPVTRRRVTMESLVAIGNSQEQLQKQQQRQRVLGKLVNQRLIVTDENTVKVATVEVAHEALLSEWSLLKKWIDDNRENIRLKCRLEEARQKWESFNKSDDLLLRGPELSLFKEWQEESKYAILDLDAEFLRKSVEKRDREKQAKEREDQDKLEQEQKLRELAEARERVQKQRTWLAIASLIAMTGLTMLAGTAAINAERGQILALSQASEAKFILNRNSLDPLVGALKAATRLKQIDWVPGNKEVREQVMETLTQAVYWVRERDRLQGHNDAVQSVSFSPDGTMLASASFDKTVKLWNIEENQKKSIVLQEKFQHGDTVSSVTFSPDSKIIASASFDKTVKLWNQDGTLKDTLPHDSLVYSVTFISNDMIATGDNSGKVTFWNSTNGQQIGKPFKPHQKTVCDLKFNKQGNILATASVDGRVKLWKLTPKLQQNPIILEHNSSVNSVSFSPDGQMIATASQNKIVKFWKLNGTPLSNLTIKGESGFTSVSFSPDQKTNKKTIATANLDGQVQLWEQNEKETKKIETLSGHTSRVKSVSFNKKGDILASASGDTTVRLWQVKLPLVTRLQADSQKVFYVSFSPDGQKFASAGQDSTVQIWDKNGNWQQSLIRHTQQVNSVDFSPPNGDKIASSSRDDTVQLWTWQGKQYQLEKTISRQSPLKSSSSVSFNPIISNPLLAFADSKGSVKILGIDGSHKNEFLAHKREIWTVIFSPNGDYLATASGDYTAKLWDIKGKPKATLEGHDAAVQDISFHPKRNLIATASEDKTVKLWNLNGQLLKNITGHSDQVTRVRFSPDGNTIATASDDRTIKLWNLDGTLITTLKGHSRVVNTISFNPTNSKILISGSSDGTIIIWRELENLTLEGLLERGCKHLHGYFQTNPQAPQNICK